MKNVKNSLSCDFPLEEKCIWKLILTSITCIAVELYIRGKHLIKDVVLSLPRGKSVKRQIKVIMFMLLLWPVRDINANLVLVMLVR